MKYLSNKAGCLFAQETEKTTATPIWLVFANELENIDSTIINWGKKCNFSANSGELLFIPNQKGDLSSVIFGLGQKDKSGYENLIAKLPKLLSPGKYYIANNSKIDHSKLCLLWAMGSYEYNYKKDKKSTDFPQLVSPVGHNINETINISNACYFAQDLINTPAADMGPEEIENVIKEIAKSFNAQLRIIKGKKLLEQNLNAIYTVGKAATEEPRLLELTWNDKKDLPTISLVGKGVSFDTGGLNIKTYFSMRNMKKDMGGAACILGLAIAIMNAKIPVRLKVFIPTVENSIASKAYRPGDIIKTHSNLTVEVGNTDAEGRLILADALSLASQEDNDMIIDFATLTGARIVALGSDIAAAFSNNNILINNVLKQCPQAVDYMWQLPLWQPYATNIKSDVADLCNISKVNEAGAIMAALFLYNFVDNKTPWLHVDMNAWSNQNNFSGKPGAKAQGIRSVYLMIKENYFDKKATKNNQQ